MVGTAGFKQLCLPERFEVSPSLPSRLLYLTLCLTLLLYAEIFIVFIR